MGNLVGAPLDQWVQKQIKVRQEVIGDNPNTIVDSNKRILHNHNKTSWVRMASSVDVNKDGLNSETIHGTSLGSNFAKNFVLFGGINFTPSLTKGGVIKEQTEQDYALLASQYSYGLGEPNRGYQPIFGLDSVKIRHLNRGAIRKYNISLKAHNKLQFEIIESLYLRLGYYMLLEWGHTVYIDGNKELQTSPEKNTDAFNDFFENGKTDNDIVDSIKLNRKKTGGNYDGALFLVSNYSWNLEDDGSYNITIEGISKGGLLGSLLLNSSSTKDSNFFNYTFPNITNDKRKEILKELKYTDTDPDNEQKIEIKYQKALGSFLSRGKYEELINAGAIVESSTNSQSKTQQKVIFENDTDDNQTVFLDQKRTKLNEKLFSFNQYLENGEWQNENGLSYKVLKDQKLLRLKLKNPNNNKNAFYYDYIQLGKLLEIIKQEYFSNSDSDNPSYEIDFLDEDNGMFTHWFQHSTDPKVCLIPFEYYDTLENTTKTSPSLNNILSQFDGSFRDKNNPYRGNLMNIFVNLEFIASTLKKSTLPETGEIPFYNFLDEIMYSIQTSLGNLNSFYITYTEDSDSNPSLKIIDDTVIPETNESNNDQHLRLFGVQPGIEGSFVRNISTQSKITDKLVTQITIGSTSTGVNSSTSLLARWNEGLEDRIKKSSSNLNNSNQDQNNEILERIKNTYDNILIFLKDVYENHNNPTSVTTAQSNLKLLLEYDLGIKTLNGSIAGKGFIPIDLSLELEGMSGMLLFQKLKVDNLILPYSYINKIDFIIQAMDHTIQNNEWTTTLSTLSVPKRKNLRNNNSNEDTIFSRLQTPVSFNITELNNSLVRNVLS